MPDLVGQTHPARVDVTPGSTPGCSLNCLDRQPCETCGEDLCPMHAPDELVECADTGFHHADDCADLCLLCDLAAREDYLSDRADAIRKGEW